MTDTTTLTTDDRIAVREAEAARLTSMSGKGLKRATDRGEPTGRFTEGRIVLYHRPTLAAWLAAKASRSGGTGT